MLSHSESNTYIRHKTITFSLDSFYDENLAKIFSLRVSKTLFSNGRYIRCGDL